MHQHRHARLFTGQIDCVVRPVHIFAFETGDVALTRPQVPAKLVTRAWEQLAAARAANQALIAQSTNAFEGYVTREQLEFAGYDTPENSFQSLNWAAMSGDYTNWLAALAPAARQEELADTNNLERFRRSNNGISGWQILASKPVGSDRVELEVEVDSQNSAAVFIYPMVAIGNEWKLGDDINPYTHAWDSPAVRNETR
jgi:hypothetical protein